MKQFYPAKREHPEAAKKSIKIQLIVMLGFFTLLPSLAGQTQGSPSPRHREIEIWISAKVGTLLGAGYTSSYLTNIRAKTMGKEDPKLRQAVDSLDGLGMLPVKGFGLVPAAVSWLTETAINTLVEQQAETNLSYAELLIAHTLAAKSGESFAHIIAMRARTRTWGELARQLEIDPEFLVTRANAASTRIRLVDLWNRRRPPTGGTTITGENPHTQLAHLH